MISRIGAALQKAIQPIREGTNSQDRSQVFDQKSSPSSDFKRDQSQKDSQGQDSKKDHPDEKRSAALSAETSPPSQNHEETSSELKVESFSKDPQNQLGAVQSILNLFKAIEKKSAPLTQKSGKESYQSGSKNTDNQVISRKGAMIDKKAC